MPGPRLSPVHLLRGVPQGLCGQPVSVPRSPQPNERAQRVSERGSVIYPVLHIRLTRWCRLFTPAT
ncbi:hypothetical protein C3455_25645 [Escherichia coli]|nr:hypothetical protein C3455_25645 [Escherichia coli]